MSWTVSRFLPSVPVACGVPTLTSLFLAGAMKGASSLTGKCHTWDVKADGYIKAEGINAVMLKRLDDAVRDGDPIRAVIRGTSTNSDGRTPGIASPSAEAQALAIRAAYANAGITDYSQTSYLECHGTGTQAGDPTEVFGASAVFGADARKTPLIIGSIKSNIGHSEPAAGISGVLKAVLALEHDVIPGNPTFITPSPKIDFEKLQVKASRTAIPWPKTALKRASVNSFGYGGSNAHVIIDEASAATRSSFVSSYRQQDDFDDFFDVGDEEGSNSNSNKRPFTLVFSANDEASLRNNATALAAHLMNPDVSVKLEDLAYTLSERRTRHFNRGYLVSSKASQLDLSTLVTGKMSTEPPRIGFVFTGQGAQWPQMGKQLLESFPLARLAIEHLDKVLRTVPDPPKWSLLRELTESRSPQALRQPEFSQPLVTALQLAILRVLRSWGVSAQAVVGHSSGEIAAACAAGLLSEEDAIKAAFYRGRAAVVGTTEAGVGMLAAGLGATEVAAYLTGLEDRVQVACYNSPDSVTLSGSVGALDEVKDRLVQDGHFARALRVDLAYHSRYMDSIGNVYEDMMNRDFQCQEAPAPQSPTMFSSVLGRKMEGKADTAYWKANMVSPVLFDDALREAISGKAGANFLIEIGPSGALAGPIGQIKKALPPGGAIEYRAALNRGQDAVHALFDVAGRLFVADAPINMAKVNEAPKSGKPKVIVDLPNYSWNHSTKYWYENEASKDWRNRMFPHHDLIGTKVLGTSHHAPIWKKALSVEDLPWLKDHRMGTDIVFPAAAFMAMAIEGVSQITEALAELEGKPKPARPCYRVRNSTYPRALVLEEGKKTNVMLRLNKRGSWYEFEVSSLVGSAWAENCRGLVRVEDFVHQTAPEGALAPLRHPTPGRLWYKAMEDVGYGFGPLFQKHLEAESTSGRRTSRSTVDLTEPPSAYTQSAYPLHPASIDGCLQTCSPALWNGNRSSVNAVLIPAIIDDVLICPQDTLPEVGLAVADASYVGVGRPEETKSYMTSSTVYDPTTGALIFQVSGLRFHKLDTAAGDSDKATHAYTRLQWQPDVSFISQEGLDELLVQENGTGEQGAAIDAGTAAVNRVLDLVAHKTPALKVAEVSVLLQPGDATSIWLDGKSSVRDSSAGFLFASTDAKALVAVQEKYGASVAGDCQLFDPTKPSGGLETGSGAGLDVVILRSANAASPETHAAMEKVQSLLAPKGFLLLLQHRSEDSLEPAKVPALLDSFPGLQNMRIISTEASQALTYAVFATAADAEVDTARTIDVVHFHEPTELHARVTAELASAGWAVSCHSYASENLQFNGPVVVLDELSAPVLPEIDASRWEALRNLTGMRHPIVWVTEGSQLEVTKPTNAMIHGLARVIRAEDPSISITTLDVQESTGKHTVPAIHTILKHVIANRGQAMSETEFVERRGILHVSRVLPSEAFNKAAREEAQGRDLEQALLHERGKTVRLRAERLGTFDALHYAEVEVPALGDNRVEVEIEAAGVNFKDVAITMGIVPENEHLLGLEGAGTIRRPGSTNYKVGDRVLVFEKGTFANRIIATTERVYPIPDWMSFEEAATLASVYLVSLYSLHDLANTQPGQRVLIHSATGGLGIACIQLCRHIGADVYVTAGNDAKRRFLEEEFGIPRSHIFNSRTTEFAAKLMKATANEGVDVVINSLTGDLLEESWRCIREGGTMVELGKKDMLDRNYLSMEPFGRNASYRCFDMAHKHVSDQVIGRLLSQLMPLVEQKIVTPIRPIKTFPFDDIPAAFRYMRGANHTGKIVITHGDKKDSKVPLRPAPRTLSLRRDVSYLLVGGLKGLCGSLAVQLARRGAKHIIPLARSGYEDEMSQAAIESIRAEGCEVQLAIGDVSSIEDVRRVFRDAEYPIAGVIQGAMVLRDKIFTSMTVEEFHQAVTCKLVGTWNLHNAAQELGLELDFFSMLSSISGVVGQRGQANYAAANAFLDAFAAYRRDQLGQRTLSIDLGAVEEVGYISRNTELLQIFDPSTWTPINEALFLRIVEQSIVQQVNPDHPAADIAVPQLITGIAVPLGRESSLLSDCRFSGLCFGDSRTDSDASDGNGKDRELAAFLLLVRSGGSDAHALLDAAVSVVNRQFQRILRLGEPMEPAKPLSSYGLDSLAAVELRNWVRKELAADLTTLDITNATSLVALCEKIVSKIAVANS
ncbi:Beta-ketoacyl synthase [Macrophomina phaseolina MS6]|uniref:Beta-ketoacyl synthase n=1 Tax=Macrophomina phaseolina (strain MS6) TaxID=1126212 RepID=K2SHN0_MACPH|nr:Beta-ketoacyl synthase [Macrophomina phaseolina MS6]